MLGTDSITTAVLAALSSAEAKADLADAVKTTDILTYLDSIDAGINDIVKEKGFKISGKFFQRPNDANAYAVGDAITDSTSAPSAVFSYDLANVGATVGQKLFWTNLRLTSSKAPSPLLQANVWISPYIFNPTNDNAAFDTLSTFTGNTTNGSATISNISAANIKRLQAGMVITGTGISAETYITAVGTDTITLSAAATADGTGITITFNAMAACGVVIPCYNTYSKASGSRCVSDDRWTLMELAPDSTMIYWAYQAANAYTPVAKEVFNSILEGVLI